MKDYKVILDVGIDKLDLKPIDTLSDDQQKHLGAILYTMSNGILNDSLKMSLADSNLLNSANNWSDLEEKGYVTNMVNEDCVSPHNVLSDEPLGRGYSAELKKPKKIKFEGKKCNINELMPSGGETETWRDNKLSPLLGDIYVYNSNFRITKGFLDTIIPIGGVEIVFPLTRYRILIGIGSEFDAKEVQYNIFKQVENFFNSV